MATVEDLPKARVTGQFLFVSQDNADEGTSPNAVLVTGYVRFTCSVTPPLVYRDKKVHAVPLVSDAVFDSQGHLIPMVTTNPSNEIVPGSVEPGMELLADSPEVNPRGFTWTVSFALKEAATGRAISIPSYAIYLSDGDDVDLADVMTVGSSGGEYITRGESAYDLAILEGFEGTRAEWLESLKIKGDQGDSIKGDTGLTPQISIGTVETIANPADGVWVAGLIKGSPDVAAALRESFPSTMKGDRGDPGIGWVTSELGTADLNTVITPGAYRAGIATNVTAERNYPIAGAQGTGILEVMWQGGTPAQAVFQRYTIIWGFSNAKVVYMRAMTGGNWSTWNMLPTQRIDNTAGKAIYTWDQSAGKEQLIYGDTGTRKLLTNNDLIANDSTSNLYVRRVGSMVTMSYRLTVLPNAVNPNGTNIAAELLPPGFRPAQTVTYGAAHEVAGVPEMRSSQIADNGGTRMWWTKSVSTSIIYGSVTVPTNDAWPASLPGVAAGPIPNY